MPPNTSSGTILDQFECSYKQAANPYSETKHALHEECPGPSGSRGTRGHEAAEPEVEDTVRVTTRARLTYELYNYSKNAMLIVHSTYNTFECNFKVEELKTTFEKFRFEVDVFGIDFDNEELYEKCRQFFQRDFTDYGAVALVILTAEGVGQMTYRGNERNFFKESAITDNFKLDRNRTLADKPKIYITEIASRWFSSDKDFNTLHIDHATHGDVIGFHSCARDAVDISVKIGEITIPVFGPLMSFCKILASMGDKATLAEIIARTKNDDYNFYKSFSPSNVPVTTVADNLYSTSISRWEARRNETGNSIILKAQIGVVNTLRKQLYFLRNEER